MHYRSSYDVRIVSLHINLKKIILKVTRINFDFCKLSASCGNSKDGDIDTKLPINFTGFILVNKNTIKLENACNLIASQYIYLYRKK